MTIIYLLNRSVSSGEASLDAAADRGMRDGVLLFLWFWSRDEMEWGGDDDRLPGCETVGFLPGVIFFCEYRDSILEYFFVGVKFFMPEYIFSLAVDPGPKKIISNSLVIALVKTIVWPT